MRVVHIFPEKVVRFPGRRRQWYLRVVSSNGEVLTVSEAYASKWGAKRAARKNFPGLQIKEMSQ